MYPNLHIGDIVVLTKPQNITTQEIIVDKNIANKRIDTFIKINYSLKTININNNYSELLDTNNIEIDGNIYTLNQYGTIIVYYSELLKKEIIHRSVLKIIANDGNYYLTKGDNQTTNTFIDQDCLPKNGLYGCITLLPIPEEEVIAKYWFKIPYLGLVKIIPFKLIGLN
jgi:hypothetical protein